MNRTARMDAFHHGYVVASRNHGDSDLMVQLFTTDVEALCVHARMSVDVYKGAYSWVASETRDDGMVEDVKLTLVSGSADPDFLRLSDIRHATVRRVNARIEHYTAPVPDPAAEFGPSKHESPHPGFRQWQAEVDTDRQLLHNSITDIHTRLENLEQQAGDGQEPVSGEPWKPKWGPYSD